MNGECVRTKKEFLFEYAQEVIVNHPARSNVKDILKKTKTSDGGS